jgi:hypothetical protein
VWQSAPPRRETNNALKREPLDLTCETNNALKREPLELELVSTMQREGILPRGRRAGLVQRGSLMD